MATISPTIRFTSGSVLFACWAVNRLRGTDRFIGRGVKEDGPGMGGTAFPRDSRAAEGYACDTPHALAAPWHIKNRLCPAILKLQSAFVQQIANLISRAEGGVIATD